MFFTIAIRIEVEDKLDDLTFNFWYFPFSILNCSFVVNLRLEESCWLGTDLKSITIDKNKFTNI